MIIEDKKIPSKRSLQTQAWACILLILPIGLPAVFSLLGWGTLLFATLNLVPSVPEGRHGVLMAAIVTLPAVILFVVQCLIMRRAEKLLEHYYEQIDVGVVSSLEPMEYRCYAIIQGVNRAGYLISKKLPVPIDKVPTVRVGDQYPWQ